MIFRSWFLIFLYLAAIVVANLSVANYGQVALIVSSWVLIPFDLVTRDILHDRWHKNDVALRMAVLILSGSAISYLLNRDALDIALASFIAFFIAGTIDTLVYWLAYNKGRMTRMNLSNSASAITDSAVFTVVAFGVFNPQLVALQSISKFLGGVFWIFIFCRLLR